MMHSVCARLAKELPDLEDWHHGARALSSAASTSVSTPAIAHSGIVSDGVDAPICRLPLDELIRRSRTRSAAAVHLACAFGAGSACKVGRYPPHGDDRVARYGGLAGDAGTAPFLRGSLLLPALRLRRFLHVFCTVGRRSPVNRPRIVEQRRDIPDERQLPDVWASNVTVCERNGWSLHISVATNVRDLFHGRCCFYGLSGTTTKSANLRTNRGQGSRAEAVDVSGQDKRGSPVEQQTIDMARVQPCRSVGVRAALCVFRSEINAVSGTVAEISAMGRGV